jgi:hypothetical protein
MADVVPSTEQEFWRSPAGLEGLADPAPPPALPSLADACSSCGTEYLIGAKFCHACGHHRSGALVARVASGEVADMWAGKLVWLATWLDWSANYWHDLTLPHWLRYLHFHEIKRGVGLPTASFVAFLIGLGCVAGTIGVSLFYRASNLGEFQAIQMWRLQWLLAAAVSFLAGILLKKPSSSDPE